MFRYPCTGNIEIKGFGKFLEEEIKEPRRNINLFSKELSEKFGWKYVSLVNSGSSANLTAVLAVKEILLKEKRPLTAVVSSFTFSTTLDALLIAGFDIKVVDCDEESFNMSYRKLVESNFKPSLILVTHFLGFPAELKSIVDYAHKNNAYVIQDACDTLGLNIDEKEISSYGDITTYSFYHPHHLSSYGGGAVVCNDLDKFIIIDSIVHWGRGCKCHIDKKLCNMPVGPAHQFTYERIGLNVELSELNACFGRYRLRMFDEDNKLRIKFYNILYNKLSKCDKVKVWQMPDIKTSVFVFPILLKDGRCIKDIYDKCLTADTEIRTLMGGAISSQMAFKDIIKGDMKNAKLMTENCFFVGIHQTLTEKDVNTVADILLNIINS